VSLYTLGEVANLQLTTYNSSGTPTDATAVTLAITNPDGTAATIGSITHTTSTGIYTYPFQTAMLGRHKVAWTATGTNATTDIHFLDVYGATVATPADLRARFTNGLGTSDLSSTTLYPDAKLRAALRSATDQWNALANVNVAPFLATKSWIGDGWSTYLLQDVEVTAISSLTIDGIAVASTAYTLGDAGVINLLSGQLFTANKLCSAVYTSGYTSPPGAVVDAIMQRAAELVIGSSVPSRTIAQGGDLGYTRFSLAGRDGSTGIPDFDSTAALYGNNGAGGFA